MGALTSVIAVRPPGTWRYSVEALHPICRAISEAVMVPDASIAFAALTLMASRATADTATGAAGRQGGSGTFTKKLDLELPKGGEDVEDQPPGRAGGVDVLVQRSQADATCRQRVHGGQKLAHGSRQTIEPGDDQHIPLASEFQGCCRKLWAIRAGAAHRSRRAAQWPPARL